MNFVSAVLVILLYNVAFWSSFVACDMKRFAFYEEASFFEGLSQEIKVSSRGRCAARCFESGCRGIHFTGNECKILYETSDVPDNRRTNYNQVALTSSGGNDMFFNVNHKCSFVKPCHQGGVCEYVECIYQCNCIDGSHYGPNCETAGNPWEAPPDWKTLHPSLNLNLDDETPYVMYNGAVHIITQNSYGFKTNGGSQYVDLGNWTNDTCFADPDSCELGFTLFAYVKIESISNHHFTGYISSMVRNVDYYGSVISGYQQKLVFQVYGNGTYYFLITQQLTFPTDWIRLTAIYGSQSGLELYVDNVDMEDSKSTESTTTATTRSGHIFLGRYLTFGDGGASGALTCDYLMIWDRRLTAQERAMLHSN